MATPAGESWRASELADAGAAQYGVGGLSRFIGLAPPLAPSAARCRRVWLCMGAHWVASVTLGCINADASL
jgi:hypothetical protein